MIIKDYKLVKSEVNEVLFFLNLILRNLIKYESVK